MGSTHLIHSRHMLSVPCMVFLSDSLLIQIKDVYKTPFKSSFNHFYLVFLFFLVVVKILMG